MKRRVSPDSQGDSYVPHVHVVPVLWQVLHQAVLDSWDAEESDLATIRERVIFVGDVIHRGMASLMLGTQVP